MERLRVKPARHDLKVAMPERRGLFLPAEGAEVPASVYWLRRVADGSVIQLAPPAAAEERAGRSRRETPKE